jgi:hypothetical protein
MTETSGYNDPGSYDAATVAAANARIIKRGYQQGYLNSLAVTQDSPTAMSVHVATGGCWIEGTWHRSSAITTLTIDAADPTLDRIDLIVARRTGTTSIELAVLKGTNSGTPVAPTLTKTLSVYELALAQISIVHGTTAITTAMITNKRLSTDCGPAACEMGFFTIDPATGNMAAGSKRITTLADPTSAQDADTQAARDEAIAAVPALPSPTGNANKQVVVNAGGTAWIIDTLSGSWTAIAGNTLRKSNDAEESTTSASYVLIKTITIPTYMTSGTFRVKFTLRAPVGFNTGWGRIYKNTVAYGTERNGDSTEEFSEDLAFAASDSVQIYAKNTGGNTTYISNFRIYCESLPTAQTW